MHWTDRRLDEDTSLIYRFQTATLGRDASGPNGEVLMATFEGTWQHADGQFVYAITNAAVELWLPDALILDFRLLEYSWGDEMGKPFNVGCHRWADDTKFPLAIVVSERCREGMTSLVRDEPFVDPGTIVFDTVDAAFAAVERACESAKE